MNEQTTLESRQKTKNGVKRLIFVVLSILLEVTLIVLLFTSLNDYAEWLNLLTRTLAAILVLYIYSEDKTATMKMP
ncbi:cardiolipin synthase, partial [Streptococcus suis]